MTTSVNKPSPPKGLGPSGRRIWRAVSGDFELDQHEASMLHELCRITDRLDHLDAVISRDGEIIAGLHGPKAHPALVEARQQAIAAARLTAALRMPDGDEEAVNGTGGRRQRRAGARGVYSM